MPFVFRVAVSLLCSLVLLSCAAVRSQADEEHFLDYSEDNFKVSFMSGNLTAAVTHDYPRVVFYHSTDPFSPTFEVGYRAVYLFNDSDANGLFTESEIEYVSYLDQNHVLWNVTPVELLQDTEAGEYAHFRMNATLDLYHGLDNETVSIPEWANITFWYRISEKNSTLSNSKGSYIIKGGTDLALNFTLDILKSVNTTGVVVGQLLQGGGSAFMFVLRQLGIDTDFVDKMVSSRFDEQVNGTSFTNSFLATDLAQQEVAYAKEDGTVKAYYRWDSVPTMNSSGNVSDARVNCSYFTTGTGMILHSAYMLSNSTGSLFQDASMGIDESAFTAKITDWLKENAVAITLLTATIVAMFTCVYLLLRYRRHQKSEAAAKSQAEDDESGES